VFRHALELRSSPRPLRFLPPTDRLRSLTSLPGAGVARTTLHRYFAGREQLIKAATRDSIDVLTKTLIQAATDQGPAIDAMRRVIDALVSVADRLHFLFGAPGVLYNISPTEHPYRCLVMELIKRGQHERAFDPELNADWIQRALFALVLRGCDDARAGDLSRHAVAATVIRSFERGACTPT
jgi:AcrR family transcriptional regulator